MRLLDADAPDRLLGLTDVDVDSLTPRQLVWADLQGPTAQEMEDVAGRMGVQASTLAWLAADDGEPHAALHGRYVRLRAVAVERSGRGVVNKPFGVIAGWRYVLTVHREPLELLDQLDTQLAVDATVGQISPAIFLAAVLNTIVTGYFKVIDAFEDDVDTVDAELLGDASSRDALTRLVEMHRAASDIRRAVTAHRDVFGSLAWADFGALAETDAAGRSQLVSDRFDRAVDAIDNARDHLAGAFDIHLALTSQRTNDVMKVLTVVSVVLLPGSLLAGLLGMNVATPLPVDEPVYFWIVVALIAALAGLTMILARRARWL